MKKSFVRLSIPYGMESLTLFQNCNPTPSKDIAIHRKSVRNHFLKKFISRQKGIFTLRQIETMLLLQKIGRVGHCSLSTSNCSDFFMKYPLFNNCRPQIHL